MTCVQPFAVKVEKPRPVGKTLLQKSSYVTIITNEVPRQARSLTIPPGEVCRTIGSMSGRESLLGNSSKKS